MLIVLENLKSIIIICLTVVVFALFYLLLSGKFCNCTFIKPTNYHLIPSFIGVL